MKGFLRNYSMASLAGIFIAAVAIFVMYRAIVIRSVTTIAEGSGVTVARLALHPIRPYLVEYFEVAGAAGRDPLSVAMPEALQDAIADMMRDTQIARIKIYNRGGLVLFSTESRQIGNDQSANQGFRTAMGGKVSARLVYRDSFNPFDQVTEDDNLVQTYIPVRRRPTEPVAGVIEMYTSVDALVAEAESSELQMLAVMALILTGLYAALLLLVYRSHELIETQQRTIREKNALLEQLSRENLRREESERKKFATDLHEGLAQTLSAVKLAVENARGDTGPDGTSSLESVIPGLQSAIGQVRTIAMDLRPSGLDDFGLVPTLEALCADFLEATPEFRVARQFTAHETDIPASLKIVVYRIVETALKIVAGHPGATGMRIGLEASNRMLTLVIEDDADAVVAAMSDESGARDSESAFMAARERAIISGGKLSVVRNASGNPMLRVSWRY
ncbi:MAG TPA: histidine kinase [Usitatibacteraceae bacterium]|nr:histidine kinase [Usitatibacteraceae bacterium]